MSATVESVRRFLTGPFLGGAHPDGPMDDCACGDGTYAGAHLALLHGDRTEGWRGTTIVLWGGRCRIDGCPCERFRPMPAERRTGL